MVTLILSHVWYCFFGKGGVHSVGMDSMESKAGLLENRIGS